MNFIDFHVDTLSCLYKEKNEGNAEATLWKNKGHIDLERQLKSGYAAQFFACFIYLDSKPVLASHFDDVIAMTELFKEGIAPYADKVAYAGSYSEYMANKAAGKFSGFLTLEEGGVIEGKLERLDTLYEKGIRAITLTWNFANCLAFPNFQYKYKDDGLTPFGFEALEKMDELGIIADVSHLSDGGFYDIYKHSKRPFMATHSNARAVQDHSRNLTDDMIKKLAEKGGITGLNFCGGFLTPDEKSTVESMLRHIRHIIDVGGLEVMGLGTDFDGIGGDLELKGAQDMPKLVEAMDHANFTTNEIEAVCYKNAENFFKRYWGE